jgi:hypothetical protein
VGTELGHDRNEGARDRRLITEGVRVPFDAVLRQKIRQKKAGVVGALCTGADWPLHRELDGGTCNGAESRYV